MKYFSLPSPATLQNEKNNCSLWWVVCFWNLKYLKGGFASFPYLFINAGLRHKIPRTISSNSVFWFTLLKMRNLKAVCYSPLLVLSLPLKKCTWFSCLWRSALCWLIFSLHLSFAVISTDTLVSLFCSSLATESTFKLAPVFPGHAAFFEAFFFFFWAHSFL